MIPKRVQDGSGMGVIPRMSAWSALSASDSRNTDRNSPLGKLPVWERIKDCTESVGVRNAV
jgi:hypothetical protein